MKRYKWIWLALLFAVALHAVAQTKPVVLRFVSDFTGRRTRQGSR